MPAHLLEGSTDRIWSQAGIKVAFLAPTQINSTGYQQIADAAEATSLFQTVGNGQHPNPLVLNMWIVKDITGAFGRADTGGNGAVITESVFTYNNGTGRLDTIAHELGHNLALDHFSWGAGGATNLMTAAGRVSPGLLCEINPGPQKLDQLNDAQIAVARSSSFARALPTSTTNPSPALSFLSAVQIFVTTVPSCCYQLLSAPEAGTNWIEVGNPIPGTATNLQWSITVEGARKFFQARSE